MEGLGNYGIPERPHVTPLGLVSNYRFWGPTTDWPFEFSVFPGLEQE